MRKMRTQSTNFGQKANLSLLIRINITDVYSYRSWKRIFAAF